MSVIQQDSPNRATEILLIEVQRDALRALQGSVRTYQKNWSASSSPVRKGTEQRLRLRALDLRDLVRGCQALLKAASLSVDSAWDHLDAEVLADPDVVGRDVWELLSNEAALVRQVLDLFPSNSHGRLPARLSKQLEGFHRQLVERARAFRDTWPWSLGARPDDPEDRLAAEQALQAMPPFATLKRLAEQSPPPAVWREEE